MHQNDKLDLAVELHASLQLYTRHNAEVKR